MKAIVVQEGKKAGVEQKEKPEIQSEEILVKVVGVTLNPTDWKHVEYGAPAGTIVGCDYSGVVEKVGADVKHISIGDKVGGLVHGAKHTRTGAFAEYVAAIGDVAWHKPEHFSHEENACFGVGSLTAAACLYQRLGLSPPSRPISQPEFLLVWSGSSSVGQFAIQLGKISGYKVITTASPKNHELLKSLGAEICFDYRDPDVVKKIKEASGNKLQHALDCCSEDESLSKCVESMGENGGQVCSILGTVQHNRKDVKIVNELLYTAMGKEIEFFGRNIPAQPQDRKFIFDFIQNELEKLTKEKKIKPNVIKFCEGGLEKIPEGLEYMKAGKVSAEKLAFHIQNE